LTCALFFKATAKEAQFIEDEYRPHEVSRDDFRQIFEECTKEKYSFFDDGLSQASRGDVL
jgi:hypothetical protein